jgi:hypothetical protein
MKVMPSSRMSTVNTELHSLGENEQCAIYLEFKDGSKERHRGTAPTPPEEGVTERNKRGGTKGGEQLEFSALVVLGAARQALSNYERPGEPRPGRRPRKERS